MGIIIDIAVGVIFFVALIVGVCMGMCRQFSRPLVGIVSIAGAICLTAVIYPLFALTAPMISFVSTAAGWFTNPIYSVAVGSVEELQQAISGSYLAVLNGVADKMFPYMQGILENTGLDITIGNFFGKIIVNVIVEFALWLAFYLAIKYLLFGIKYLLKKITSVVVFKSIDKIFGIIWSVALTYVIVVGIVLSAFEIVVSLAAPGFAETLSSWIAGTTVLKFLHNTNVLGSFIANMFGLPLLTLPA